MAEYDDLLGRGEYRELSRDELIRQRDAARAELATANARIAELEKKVVKAYKMRHNHITRDIKPDGECAGCDAYHLRERNAENDALSARLEQIDSDGGIADLFAERDQWRKTAEALHDRLERVRALAEWKLTAPSTVPKSEIRAALGEDA